MQFSRYLTYPKHLNNIGVFWFVVRTVLLVMIVIILFRQSSSQTVLWQRLGMVDTNWSVNNLFLTCLVLLLMPINWFLEAKKWQLLCQSTQLSLSKAIKSVMLGLSLESVMPFGTGSATGRVMSLNNTDRTNDFSMAFIGQWTQTLITLLAGVFGTYVVVQKGGLLEFSYSWELFFISLIVLIIGFFTLRHFEIGDKVQASIQPIRNFNWQNWLKLFAYSGLRYLVFLSQFVLLLFIFNPQIELWLSVALSTWVFVARTIVPRLTSLETLGIRAAAAWYFSSLFALAFSGIMYAIIVLWIINLLLPSLIGLYYLSELKWRPASVN